MKTKRFKQFVAALLSASMIVSNLSSTMLSASATTEVGTETETGTAVTTYASWNEAALAAVGAAQTSDNEDNKIAETAVDFTYSSSYTNTEGKTQYIVDTIYTAKGFAYFAYTVNNEGQSYGGLTITLANDIALADAGVSGYTATDIASSGENSWTSIGTGALGDNDKNPFSGSFDGAGHTISAVYINNSTDWYQGLFGYTQTSSGAGIKIKDLTVTDVRISGTSYVGALVGYLGADITVENVEVTSADITGTGNYVAGAIAYAYVNTKISNVDVNDSTVTQAGTGENTSYIGGVVGYAEVSETGSQVTGYTTTITDCDSNATITIASSVGTASAYAYYAGGIVGRACANTADSTAGLEIKNCSFSGAIEVNSLYFESIGGIAGDVSSINGSVNVLVEGCYNTGNITGISSYIGGIVGKSGQGTITKCYNTGDITSTTKPCVGGIAGYMTNSTISYCYNTGAVQGYDDVGGITGYIANVSSEADATLTACYSIGTASATATITDPCAGGIVGDCSNSSETNATITYCYYNKEMIEDGLGDSEEGIDTSSVVGLTTLEMTGTTDNDDTDNATDRAQDSMTGFNDGTWTFTADVLDETSAITTYYRYYPVLTDNAQNPAPSVKDVADAATWTQAASLAIAGTDYVLDEGAKTLVIYTSTGLAYFADTVNSRTSYSDYTVRLANAINLDDGTVTGYGFDEATNTIGSVNWTAIGTDDAPRIIMLSQQMLRYINATLMVKVANFQKRRERSERSFWKFGRKLRHC